MMEKNIKMFFVFQNFNVTNFDEEKKKISKNLPKNRISIERENNDKNNNVLLSWCVFLFLEEKKVK